MAMIPLLVARIVRDDVGDLEYIQGFVVSGNYFQVSGDIDNLTDTIEFIVPNGKRALMIEAKIVITTHTTPPAMQNSTVQNTVVRDIVTADFQFITPGPTKTVKDTTNVGTTANVTNNGNVAPQVGGTGTGNVGDGRFNVLGLSLVGDGVDTKIQIENTLDDGTAFATMSGYLIDT